MKTQYKILILIGYALAAYLINGCSGSKSPLIGRSKLTVLGYTQHTYGSTDWTEHRDNKIIGFEFPISDNGSIEFTDLTNSFGDPARTLNYNYRWRAGGDTEFLGIKLGLASGYNEDPEYLDPFFMPVFTKDFEHISIDFHALPIVWALFLKYVF